MWGAYPERLEINLANNTLTTSHYRRKACSSIRTLRSNNNLPPTAIGAGVGDADSARASGEGSVALGGARYNTSGILITAGASANGINAVAIGGDSSARETNALALGASANASGVNGVAVGRFASTSGLNVYAMGLLANASADFATAVGASAAATGTN